jgi:NAD+ synthase
MTTLYALAQSMGFLVAGTGNLSEATVGYCTKWGDTASDFNPLALYTCSEVIEIGRQILPDWVIDRDPADGLWGKTDEDNLGFTYAVLDRYIREGVCEDEAVREKIDRLHRINRHKFEPMPAWRPDF